MSNTALFKVLSPKGATVAQGSFSITYVQNDTFYADVTNLSVIKLLQANALVQIPTPNTQLNQIPTPVIIAQPGPAPAGPPGPPGPSGASVAHHLATTGSDVVIDTAPPPSVGQVLTATSATAADWETPSTVATALATTTSPVVVSGATAPSTGQVLAATSGTTATWQNYIAANGSVAFTADQSLGSHKLTNVTDPSSAQDAATKNYVDGKQFVFNAGGTNGQTFRIDSAASNIVLNTGATTTNGPSIPANSVVLGASYRVTTTITTAANFKIGDGTTVNQFFDTQSTLTSGTTGVGYFQLATPKFYGSSTPTVITTDVNPGAGAIRVTVHYMTFGAATS